MGGAACSPFWLREESNLPQLTTNLGSADGESKSSSPCSWCGCALWKRRHRVNISSPSRIQRFQCGDPMCGHAVRRCVSTQCGRRRSCHTNTQKAGSTTSGHTRTGHVACTFDGFRPQRLSISIRVNNGAGAHLVAHGVPNRELTSQTVHPWSVSTTNMAKLSIVMQCTGLLLRPAKVEVSLGPCKARSQ